MNRRVELLFDNKIKGSLKRFVDVMYSVTKFKRKLLLLCAKVLSAHNNKWDDASSFKDRRFGLSVLTICKRDYLSFLELEQWKR